MVAGGVEMAFQSNGFLEKKNIREVLRCGAFSNMA
jgi:hypothetical protein